MTNPNEGPGFQVDLEVELSIVRAQRADADNRAARWQAAAHSQQQAVQQLGQMVAERDEKIADLEAKITVLEELEKLPELPATEAVVEMDIVDPEDQEIGGREALDPKPARPTPSRKKEKA